MKTMRTFMGLLLLAFLLFLASTDGAYVSRIWPRDGGSNKVLISIEGGLLPSDPYKSTTKIYFVNNAANQQRYDCDVHEEMTSETLRKCYTSEMPYGTWYYLRAEFDGEPISLCGSTETYSYNCGFYANKWNTPRVSTLYPQSGPPSGQIITFVGQTLTDKYGSHVENSTYGRVEAVLRASVGPSQCLLRVDDEVVGMQTTNRYDGYIKCQISGSAIGSYNASFLLETPLGKSLMEKELFHVSVDKKIYTYQSYASVSGVSPQTGSTNGGTLLTISGTHFGILANGAPNNDITVTVGGKPCTDVTLTADKEITCKTSAEPGEGDGFLGGKYPGGRGVVLDRFDGKLAASNLHTLAGNTDTPEVVDWTDQLAFCDEATNIPSCMTKNTNLMAGDDFSVRGLGFFAVPWNGDYSFFVKGDKSLSFSIDCDGSNLTEVASIPTAQSNYFKISSQISSKMTLTAGTMCNYQLLHSDTSSKSYAFIAAAYYDTNIGRMQSGKAVNEQQNIIMSSAANAEIQKITFTELQTQNLGTEEVQTLSYPPGDAKFQLCFWGTCSAVLDIGSLEASDIETALKDLAGHSTSMVTGVVDTSSGAEKTFDITFDKSLGDHAMLTVINVDGDSQATVTEKTTGVSDRSYLRFTYSWPGSSVTMFSGLLETATLSLPNVQTAFEELFTAKCPEGINPSGSKYYNNFEEADNDKSAVLGGYADSEVEPFCGKASRRNPGTIFEESESANVNSIALAPGRDIYVCFAYKGSLQPKIKFRFQVEDSHTQDTTMKSDDGEWHYTCEMLTGVTKVSTTKIKEVLLFREDTSKDYWVDAVYVGYKKTTLYTDGDNEAGLRMRAGRPVGAMSVDVTMHSHTYTVAVQFESCASAAVGQKGPLFQVLNVGASDETGDSATFHHASWPDSMDVDVLRTTPASPPIGGTWTLSYKSVTIGNLSPDISAEELQAKINSGFEDVGQVSVGRSGTCSGYSYHVEWTQTGGNRDTFVGDWSALTGVEVAVEITENDGYLLLDPIQGEMLRTAHDKPQVEVSVNGIPSKCDGDCSFEWTAAATPVVTTLAVAPSRKRRSLEQSEDSKSRKKRTTGDDVAPGDTLTIEGTGFGPTVAENEVSFGTSEKLCVVTSASATEIKCTVPDLPPGEYSLKVSVAGSGNADINIGTVVVSAGAFTFAPASGSKDGGTKVVVTRASLSGLDIKVGANAAEVLSTAEGSVTICTPPGTGEKDLIVGTKTSSSKFTYTETVGNAITLDISSTMIGGENVTISGTFPESTPTVKVGAVSAKLISSATSAIVVELPGMDSGTHDLVVSFADTCPFKASIKYGMTVTKVCPPVGSAQGGTKVTITGTDFNSDDEGLSVMFGDSACDVTAVTDTEISCTSSRGVKTHVISNGGTSDEFGLGYEWKPSYLQVAAGDFVEWKWASPRFVTKPLFSVIETDSDYKPLEGGFKYLGSPSPNGVFTHQFPMVKTTYFTSGCVDGDSSCKIVLHGTIEVLASISTNGPVSVKRKGYEASYSVATCTGYTEPDAIGDCVNAAGAAGDDFNFEFKNCQTPTVTKISPNQGYMSDTITITGTGLSSDCDNEVTIGNAQCVVSNKNDTHILCVPETSDELTVTARHPVNVYICGRGNAVLDIESVLKKTYAVTPHITSVSPSVGSVKGGTLLKINGTGFVGSKVSVNFKRADTTLVECVVQRSSVEYVECRTGAPGAEIAGEIVITVSSQLIPAVCDTGKCDYAYESASTPQVTTAVLPEVCGDSTKVTLVGTGFTESMQVYLGEGEERVVCDGDSNATHVVCNFPMVAAGTYDFSVIVNGKGKAETETALNQISACLKIDTVSPDTGSVSGGTTITVTGSGFKATGSGAGPVISVGGNVCVNTIEPAIDTMTCVTSAGSSTPKVTVSVNQLTSNGVDFAFESSSTPTVTSVDKNNGVAGQDIVITGVDFGTVGSALGVTVGDAVCAVGDVSDTSIECTLGASVGGAFKITVHRDNLGYGSQTLDFSYTLSVGTPALLSGSFGGGQMMTIPGDGFYGNMSVTICDVPCTDVTVVSQTSMTCVTPMYTGDDADSAEEKACGVVINSVGGAADLADDSLTYTYQKSKTATVTNVEPRRGGTGGGVVVTITGTGFAAVKTDNAVTIGGVDCPITTAGSTIITCTTEPRTGTIETFIKVTVKDKGSNTPKDADFHYIDVWSSPFTWGYADPPSLGEFVVISKGQTILIDQNIAKLKMLLIDGGTVVFDDTRDIHLESEFILITNGGTLQVGTEEEPYQHNAMITLHGNLQAQELPIYGAKGIGLREGTLDLHGKPVRMTWTRLGATVAAGATEIKLEHGQADWQVGDQIVIATTGHRHSQSETETNTITSKSDDGKTIGLGTALKFGHLGETRNIGASRTIEMRAEVGRMTRNVVVRGSEDPAWNDEIEACPEGFDTGEFVTQTCFQGRFGDDVGSDQFGAHILMHAPEKDKGMVTGRFSHVELYYMGQAFKLGRYPIHSHINGDMSGSYVRGCSIHNTFNRAVNVHATSNFMIEHNVVYNVMGGALFLEDGIESNNTFQYNLALFVIASSSLLNDDVTPAAFWATNPDNTHQHNTAAGGTHFAFWYRMKEHPEGPSHDTSYCPREVALKRFFNNTAHSQGWFGLWTFQDYYPRDGAGKCGSGSVVPVLFESLTAWHCEKGAEFVNGGALQFKDFVMVANEKAGFEGKRLNKLEGTAFTDNGPMLFDSVIAAHTNLDIDTECTDLGLILPWSTGWITKNTTFINFDDRDSNCAAIGMTKIDGTCGNVCGGYTYEFSQIKWEDSTNKGKFRWPHDGMFHDMDGTLTAAEGGVANSKILRKAGFIDPVKCVAKSMWGTDAVMCDPELDFLRVAWNHISPTSLEFKDAILTSDHGSQNIPYNFKRLTHKEGWMAILQTNQKYDFSYKDIGSITNISYSGSFYGIAEGHYIEMVHKVEKAPDMVGAFKGATVKAENTAPELAENCKNGHTYYDKNSKTVTYVINSNDDSFNYAGRPSAKSNAKESDQEVTFQAFQCFWTDCVPPVDTSTLPPARERPALFTSWTSTPTPYAVETGVVNGEDKQVLTVNGGGQAWVVLDRSPADTTDSAARKKRATFFYDVFIIPGEISLEIATQKNEDGTDLLDSNGLPKLIEISAEHILIYGRLYVGFPDDLFKGQLDIILRGDLSSVVYEVEGSPPLGAKAIGVYGGLEIHAYDIPTAFAMLSTKLEVGSKTITLDRDVANWAVGDEIAVTTTAYTIYETETFEIEAISADLRTLTVTAGAKYIHEAHTLDRNGETLHLAAEVALLSRRVRIIGETYTDQVKDGFGGRVLVSTAQDDGQARTGYARITNTEFVRMGQLGHISPWDARFALTFYGVGDPKTSHPFTVSKNVFRDGFSPAIGLVGANMRTVEDNVMYHTVGGAVFVESSTEVRVIGNLAIFDLWPGAYEERSESSNFNYEGTFDTKKAPDAYLENNVVAGSERIGYMIAGLPCTAPAESQWKNNKAHGVLTGAALHFEYVTESCVRTDGFFIWRAWDFGIYHQVASSIVGNNHVLIENGIGFFPYTISQSALEHIRDKKTHTLSGSFVSGATSEYDCDALKQPNSDTNVRFSGQARTGRGVYDMIGVALPNFLTGDNEAFRKLWTGIMAYNAIDGLLTISDTTFTNFKGTHCNARDYMLATNGKNGDLIHPTQVERLTLVDGTIDRTNIVYFHRSDLGIVNPSDCVDMVCDSMKKVFVKDLDGTLLGVTGTTRTNNAIVPDAGYQWKFEGGPAVDDSHGMGDYRIPKIMLTDADGARVAEADVFTGRGIHRDSSCVYVDEWNAFDCQNNDYEMLVAESMDADTELRRLSPIALLSTVNGAGKYVDLINGPQDHGWCSGYTCQKRVSLFHMMVAEGLTYKMYLTGTNPQVTRLYLLNMEDKLDKGVVVGVYYHTPLRIDVFADGNYVYPINSEIVDGNFKMTEDTTLPTVANPSGTNYFDRTFQILYVNVRGTKTIELQIKEVVTISLSLPPLTIDEFFGENLVSNLAMFLGVPLDKIRVVSIVKAVASSKRAASVDSVVVEIGDAPESSGTSLDTAALVNITRVFNDQVQTGDINTVLNTTVIGVTVTEPQPEPGSAEWAELTANEEAVGGTPTLIPTEMRYSVELVAGQENVVFSTAPCVSMIDGSNDLVLVLGSRSDPWKVTATLTKTSGSHADAELIGTTTVGFKDGWANFTDLGVSHPGEGYGIVFTVTDPVSTTFTASSSAFSVEAAQIQLSVYEFELSANTSDETGPYHASFGVVTSDNNLPMLDLGWKGHTWSATINVAPGYTNPTGTSVSASQNVTFSETTGKGVIYDIMVPNVPGSHFYIINMWSTPADYNMTAIVGPVVIPSVPLPSITASASLQTRFGEEYETIDTTKFSSAVTNALQLVANDAAGTNMMSVSNVELSQGSIVCTFTLTSVLTNGTQTFIDALLDQLSAQSFAVSVGGIVYVAENSLLMNGANQVTDAPEASKSMNMIIIIASAVVGGLLLFAIFIMLYFLCKKKDSKVEQTPPSDVEMRAAYFNSDAPPHYSPRDYADASQPQQEKDYKYSAPGNIY